MPRKTSAGIEVASNSNQRLRLTTLYSRSWPRFSASRLSSALHPAADVGILCSIASGRQPETEVVYDRVN